MNYFETFLFVIELLSITSFAISGSITALKKNMDMFGVIILGVVTSIGGGIIRDIVLGINPPKTFTDPSYAIVAALTSLITFIFEYYRYKKKLSPINFHSKFADLCLFWLDTIGIAIFTMIGIATAYEISSEYSAYLLCFVGVITGVGGGLSCDILAGNTPRIFVRHVYACACIAGSVLCVCMWNYAGHIISMICGAALIVILRFFAMKYKWNFPKIKGFEDVSESDKSGDKNTDTQKEEREENLLHK